MANDTHNAAREGILAVVSDLKDLRDRLLELTKPLLADEEDGEKDPGGPVSLGVVVQCVIVDCLEPAIRDLDKAVASG